MRQSVGRASLFSQYAERGEIFGLGLDLQEDSYECYRSRWMQGRLDSNIVK